MNEVPSGDFHHTQDSIPSSDEAHTAPPCLACPTSERLSLLSPPAKCPALPPSCFHLLGLVSPQGLTNSPIATVSMCLLSSPWDVCRHRHLSFPHPVSQDTERRVSTQQELNERGSPSEGRKMWHAGSSGQPQGPSMAGQLCSPLQSLVGKLVLWLRALEGTERS